MSQTSRGYLLALIGVTLLSPDALLIRLWAASPLEINVWRGLGAGLLLLGYCRFQGALRPQIAPAGYWALACIAANALGNLSFVYAISHAGVTNVLVIIAFNPLLAAVLSALFLSEQVKAVTWAACLITSIGLSLLLLQPSAGDEAPGLISAVVCAISLAAQFVIIRAFPRAELTSTVAFGNILGGAICLAVVLNGAGTLTLSAQQIPYMLLTIALVVPIPFLLFVLSLRYISAAQTGLIMLLESVLGSIWVWWWLHEIPSTQTLYAAGLILTTLFIHGYWVLRNEYINR